MQTYRDYEDFDPIRKKPRKETSEGENQSSEISSDYRPEALKVLAILTFVGAGISMLFALIFLVLIYVAVIWHPPQAGPTSFSLSGRSNFQIAFMSFCAVLMVSSFICIIGAALMLKQRLAGFWIYILAQTAHVISALFLLVAAMNSGSEYKFILLQISNLLLCASFAVVYSVNKKHLR